MPIPGPDARPHLRECACALHRLGADMRIVTHDPSEVVAAVARGEVDIVVTSQPAWRLDLYAMGLRPAVLLAAEVEEQEAARPPWWRRRPQWRRA